MKKGFTLIELLAVIVILAIISLIATPIVLSIINDTSETSLIQSAEFYVEALKNAIMQENMNHSVNGVLNPEVCYINNDGTAICDGKTLFVEVDGQKPSDGIIEIKDGKILDIELDYLSKKIIMNENSQLVIQDNLSICKLLKGNRNTIGSKYECEVKPGTKYNFYILSKEENGTTNLIMERNICLDGSIATSNTPCLVEWNSSGYSSVGPVTAMDYLNNATSTWDNIENLNITYNDEEGNFSGFTISSKARLPKYSEIHGEGKCLTHLENNDKYGSCPLWLVNYLNVSDYYSSEQGKIDVGGIWGYWTLSSYAGFENSALYVHYYGDVGGYSVGLNNHLGVRAVINIKL